jgi:hypothetical protein
MKTQHSIGRVLVLALILTQFGAPAPAENITNHEHWVAARALLESCTRWVASCSSRACVKEMRPCA